MSALPSDFNSINRSDRSARKLASRETETTNSTLYECPQGRSASIESIWIANTTAISGDFHLYHVTPRETAGDDNALMHHIAIDVEDILAEMKRLEGEGFILLNKEPKVGADNKLICFLHPKSTNGVLVELCQEKH